MGKTSERRKQAGLVNGMKNKEFIQDTLQRCHNSIMNTAVGGHLGHALARLERVQDAIDCSPFCLMPCEKCGLDTVGLESGEPAWCTGCHRQESP